MKNVIAGFEPHNEPYHPTWATWAGMCETLFPIVNAIAPDWMMFVDGVGGSDDGSDTYWWGGYLKGVASRPVNLGAEQHKLAYAAHDYGQGVSAQTWLSSNLQVGGNGYPVLPARAVAGYPDNLEAEFEGAWGFIFTQGIAPLWVDEFGGGFGVDYGTGLADPLQTSSAFETQWAQKLVQYLNGGRNDGSSILTSSERGLSFAYFALNPESGNPLGGLLLNSDYATVQTVKMNLLVPLLNNTGA
jgi:aryl-phospho-beta-D-glucosidase BglC (GH1 family)